LLLQRETGRLLGSRFTHFSCVSLIVVIFWNVLIRFWSVTQFILKYHHPLQACHRNVRATRNDNFCIYRAAIPPGDHRPQNQSTQTNPDPHLGWGPPTSPTIHSGPTHTFTRLSLDTECAQWPHHMAVASITTRTHLHYPFPTSNGGCVAVKRLGQTLGVGQG